MMKKKTTQGRKKIAIKKIEDQNSRQVTFSKRRAGLFNKASELSILTGAEAAILVESPGGRVFAFGHPDVETVINLYLGKNSSGDPGQQQAVSELDPEYSEISKELEAEKNKKVVAKETGEAKEENNNGSFWWEDPIEGSGLDELEERITAIEKLRDNLLARANELAMERKSSTSGPTTQNPTNNNNVFRVDDYLANEHADLYKNDDDMVCEDRQI